MRIDKEEFIMESRSKKRLDTRFHGDDSGRLITFDGQILHFVQDDSR